MCSFAAEARSYDVWQISHVLFVGCFRCRRVFRPEALVVYSLAAKAAPTMYGRYRMFYSLGVLDVGGSLGPIF